MTQQNMVVDEFDLSDAPEMPSGIFTNYGKLTLSQKWYLWKDGVKGEVTREEFRAAPSMVNGKNAKQLDMVFAVDLQEFKPSLSFTYERAVQVDGLDWQKIVAPSIEAVYGKGSMVKGDTQKGIADTRNATLAKLNGKYVAYQDVLQTATKKKPDPKYNCFKLVKVYDTREACYADFVAAGGNRTSSENGAESGGFDDTVTKQNPDVPTGFDSESWLAVKPDVQTAVMNAETPLIEALNAKNTKLPKPMQKKTLDAAMPGIHAQAIVAAATKLSEEWGLTVTPDHIAKLLGA